MAAMKRYPRSFLQLITIGHILFALPLLVASGYVFFTLQVLNSHYRAAIEHASISSRLSGELEEDLLHMERNLRRYLVLKDVESLNDYVTVRTEWQRHVGAFAKLSPLPEQMLKEMQAQLALENDAYLVLKDTGNAQPLQVAIDELKLRSQNSLDEAKLILDREQEQFLKDSEVLSTRLMLAAGSSVLIALCCLWAIRKLLARLIGRFERALLRLGKGDLQQMIELDGPGDLRWLGRWLEWLRKRLLSLEKDRAQVLQHVSHELKTPLAAMHEGASLLAEEVSGPLSADQRRIVSILQSNARRLQDLIEGLLRLQQAGHAAERIGFEVIRFDLLIEQVLETCRLIASERRIQFQCVLSETKIVAGREALMTIIHNLLSNAIKFSPDGGCVCITLVQDGDKVMLDVIDQGPGVPDLDKLQIFEPFYRSSASRHIAGIGLGLAIAREFVLAQRGELLLIDSPAGAHFRVVLPLSAPYLRIQSNV
jgi:two-component system sensor histidine kinase GlrK